MKKHGISVLFLNFLTKLDKMIKIKKARLKTEPLELKMGLEPTTC